MEKINTAMQQFIEALKKEGYKIDDLDIHNFMQLEKEMLLETFTSAQALVVLKDETRASQYYYKRFNVKL